ncbi:hypothetical protein L9F63_000967 [Diploptera punctata]|uniref:GIY-YIG domain-containing protein n=1 Tax=Diploptera punctata TaxID=6984 RepID=A0AAD8ALC9_DIPPU|nr:hypothetical protein L9F63_000967 [Diploptera punctata]
MNKENYEREKEHIINVATKNGFAIKMILKKINKFKRQKFINQSTLLKVKEENVKFRKFTYHPLKHHKFQKMFKDFYIRLAPKNDYSISRLIRPNKNEKIKEENKSGIYQIKCEECEKFYIRKTKRNLKTRVKEHLRNVKKGEVEKSAVAAHAWSEKHLIEKEAKLLKQIEKPKRTYCLGKDLHSKERKEEIDEL